MKLPSANEINSRSKEPQPSLASSTLLLYGTCEHHSFLTSLQAKLCGDIAQVGFARGRPPQRLRLADTLTDTQKDPGTEFGSWNVGDRQNSQMKNLLLPFK